MSTTTFGYFEMYATYIGWFFYNETARFIIESGLLAVIPIWVFVQSYIRTKESGLNLNWTVNDVATKSIYVGFFVIFFFLPWIQLDPSEVVFQKKDGEAVNIEVNDSSFRNNFNATEFNNVRVPLGWYALMSITGGINTQLISMFPNVNNLREELMYVNSVRLNDPRLAKEARRFHDECYTKAVNYFKNSETTDNPLEFYDEDEGVLWAGAKTITELYGSWSACTENCAPVFRADRPVEGFSVDPRVDIDPEYAQGGETSGRPLCSVWWPRLKDSIYAEISEDQLSSLDAVSDQIVGFNEEKRKTFLVREAMTDVNSQEFSSPNTQYADDRMFGGWFASWFSGGAVKYEQVKTSGAVYAVVRSLPLIQGLILLVLYFSMPLLMFFGRLSLKACLGIFIGYFTVRFLTVLWQLAYWIDQFFIGSNLPPEANDAGVFESISGGTLDRAYLEFMLLSSYVVIPLVFSLFMGWVGYRLSNNIGTSAMALGAAHKSAESKVA